MARPSKYGEPTHRTHVILPLSLHSALKQTAEHDGTTVGELLVEAARQTHGRRAHEIHAQLIALSTDLEQLLHDGRVSMAEDSWNEDWTDLKKSSEMALTGLQVAINATRWMQTDVTN